MNRANSLVMVIWPPAAVPPLPLGRSRGWGEDGWEGGKILFNSQRQKIMTVSIILNVKLNICTI